MSNLTVNHSDPKLNQAVSWINDFVQNFGTSHLYFACHAAFPLALTPNLAYHLWEHFQRDRQGQSLNIHWFAVSDFLLSPLCQEVDTDLYEVDRDVRKVLLNELVLLTKDNGELLFGRERLQELAEFLLKYIKHQLGKKGVETEPVKVQQWIALAYTSDKQSKAAEQIAETLQSLMLTDSFETVRLGSLLEVFAEPLKDYQYLLKLGQGIKQFGWGNTSLAMETFKSLSNSSQIGQVKLSVPKFFNFQTVTVNKKGDIIHTEKKSARYLTEDLGDGIILDMVEIPGGTFLMGANDDNRQAFNHEKPQHEVTLRPFFMAKYPITQAQWRAVAQMPQVTRDLDPNPSGFKGDQRPVERVSWLDAVEFCARLRKYTQKDYGLPSESQWEYACRAGTRTPFYFGEMITTDLVNYNGNHLYGDAVKGENRKQTTDVGIFPPNAFGLYDMHGNVWEWCADEWHGNYEGAPTDGSAWTEDDNHSQRHQPSNNLVEEKINFNDNKKDSDEKINTRRLLRGGSWVNDARYCRSAYRYSYSPEFRNINIGFRLVVSQ